MHVHCPHCRSPIEVVEDQELRDVTCPSCGSSFNLLPDETVTRAAVEHRTLGHFELIDRIGVGAFGEVWTAHDSELDRTVAIKLPRKGQLSAEEAESFLREARSAARLNHPSIVAVHEVGKADDQLFIVSDYVRGVTLADWLTGKRPTPRESAALLAQLADAVHHAHEHGVIHRDLKPSNIMLDDLGQPHIMDFGLAKRDAGEITMTIEGKVLGTPAYMSPEQAKGAAHNADASSDVYSLGVILFELLTGELPFRGNARMLIHQVINDEPPSPRKFNGQIPPDLNTVCLKCLEKEREKRYRASSELAADLRRWLAGDPIEARPMTVFTRAWRHCKRRPLVTGLITTVLGLLVIIAIVAPVSAYRQSQLRRQAEREATENRRLLYMADMGRAREAWERGDLLRLELMLDRHVPRGDDEDLRSFEWFYLWRLWERESNTQRIKLPGNRKYTANNLAIPATGSIVAVGHPGVRGGGRVATVVDTANGHTESFGWAEKSGVWPALVALSNDGALLAYSTNDPATVVIRDLAARDAAERSIQQDTTINVIRFSPDSNKLAIGCKDSPIVLWDLKTWKAIAQLNGNTSSILSLMFSPDGSVLVAGRSDGSLCAWNLSTRELLWTPESRVGTGIGLDLSPDGKYIASGMDSNVAVTDAQNGRIVRILSGPRDQVRSIAFSRDGKLLAAGSRDGQIRLWLLPDFVEHAVIGGYNSMYALGFLPKPERKLVFGGYEGRLVIRDVQSADHEDILPAPHLALPANAVLASPRGLVFSPDSQILAAVGAPRNRSVHFWRLTEFGVDDLTPLPLDRAGGALAISHDGLIAACDANTPAIHLFDLQTRQLKSEFKNPGGVPAACAAFSPSGQKLALGYGDRSFAVLDVRQGKFLVEKHNAHAYGITCLSFWGNDSTLATGSEDGSTVVWDIRRDGPIRNLGRHEDEVSSLAASRDGNFLAAGHFAGSPEIMLWRRQPDFEATALRGHTLTVWGLAFFGDNQTLLSVSGDRTVRLWDVPRNTERFLIEEKATVCSLAISPDEHAIAVWINNDTIRLYRAATPAEVQAVPGWWIRTKTESRD